MADVQRRIEATLGGGVPLLGRHDELAMLTRAWASATAGHGACYLIAGDAGMGKSRLAAELAATVDGTVAWGHCWEDATGPPLWPWPEVAAAVETAAGLVAPKLVTEASDRFTHLAELSSFLVEAARLSPLLVVVDDLHWASLASLRAIQYLIGELPAARILLVGTYRPAEAQFAPAPTALAAVMRQSHEVQLGGLAPEVATELLETLGTSSSELGAVRDLCEGNPFFLIEMASVLMTSPPDRPVHARPPLPASVRETVLHRVRRLSDESRQLIEAAAVVGPAASVSLLEEIVGAGTDSVLQDAAPAVRAGVLRDAGGGRYAFVHALTRHAVYGNIRPERRARLHASVLESLARSRDGAPPAALAAHAFEAAAVIGRDAALSRVLPAARAAEQSQDHDQAALWLARAIDLTGPAGSRVDLLVRQGAALRDAGEPAQARAVLLEAVDGARATADAARLAEAVLAMPPRFEVVDNAPLAAEMRPDLINEALERLPATDGVLRARALATLALSLYWAGTTAARTRDWEGARPRRERLADEAVEMARRLGDAPTLAYCLTAWLYATWGPDTPPRRQALIAELSEVAAHTATDDLRLEANRWEVLALLEKGRFTAAGAAITAFETGATRTGRPLHLWTAAKWRATLALLEGDAAGAEAAAVDAISVGHRELDEAVVLQSAGVLFATLRLLQGRPDEVAGSIEDAVAALPQVPGWRCGLAATRTVQRSHAGARDAFEHLAADGFAALPRDLNFLGSLVTLAPVCAYLGDRERAEQMIELLEPFADRVAVQAFGNVVYGPVAWALGALAATAGDPARAVGHFEHALAVAAESRLLRALTTRDLAGALAATGDVGRAEPLAREAAASLRQLGFAAGALTGGPPPAPATPQPVRESPAAALRRQGEFWTVAAPGGSQFSVKDTKGLQTLAVLVANPRQPYHVLDLVAVVDAAVPPSGDAGPMVDAAARDAYRGRMRELADEIAEAERWNDLDRAAVHRVELEQLVDELASSLGLDGTPRRAGSAVERARVNVTKWLRRAVAAIGTHDGTLGHHLDTAVRTGTFCEYRPDPTAGIQWTVG